VFSQAGVVFSQAGACVVRDRGRGAVQAGRVHMVAELPLEPECRCGHGTARPVTR